MAPVIMEKPRLELVVSSETISGLKKILDGLEEQLQDQNRRYEERLLRGSPWEKDYANWPDSSIELAYTIKLLQRLVEDARIDFFEQARNLKSNNLGSFRPELFDAAARFVWTLACEVSEQPQTFCDLPNPYKAIQPVINIINRIVRLVKGGSPAGNFEQVA